MTEETIYEQLEKMPVMKRDAIQLFARVLGLIFFLTLTIAYPMTCMFINYKTERIDIKDSFWIMIKGVKHLDLIK